jgi:hypothetical protein
MTFQRFFLTLFAVVTLASCSPSDNNQQAGSKAFQLIDYIGQFEGDIGGLNFWHHPVNNYEGGVIAANGEAGLVFISIEGIASQVVPGAFFVKPDIVYLDGDEALIFAPDRNRNELIAIRKSLNGTGLEEVLSFPLEEDISGFCMIDSLSGVFIQENGRAVYRKFGHERSARQLSGKDKYSDCETDPVTGRLFLSTSKGKIVEVNVDGEIIRTFKPNLGSAFDFDLYREEEGGLFLIAFSNNTGIVLSANDNDKGRGKSFHLTKTNGFETVENVKSFAMTGGNLGSVYRNGVIAIIDSDGQLYFAPWAGLADESDVQEVLTLGPRPPRNSIEEDEQQFPIQLDSAIELPELSGADQ